MGTAGSQKSNKGCFLALVGLLSFCILGPFGIAIFAIWMSKLSRDKKIKFTAITALLGLLCIGMLVVWSILMPAKFELKSPNNTEVTVLDPTIRISFECTKVDSVTLNGTLLNANDKSSLCSNGLNLPNLNAGANTLEFEAKISYGQGTIAKAIRVNFDKDTYDKNVARMKAEEERLVQEQHRQQEEAQRVEKEKQEQERQRIENLINDKASAYCSNRANDWWKYPMLKKDGTYFGTDGYKEGYSFTLDDCKNTIRIIMEIESEEALGKVANKRFWIGMREVTMLASLGSPNDANETVFSNSKHTQYVYGEFPNSTYIYVEDGYVTSYQD